MNRRCARRVALGLLLMVAVACAGPVEADSPGDFYFVVVGNSVTITGYRGTSPEAYIPERIDSLPVTRIASGAFVESPGLTLVHIPPSVETISETAFGYGLWNYTSGLVTLHSIQVDPDNPFYSSEDGVLFDKGKTRLVRYPLSRPGSTYRIPDTVTSLAESAFLNCDGLISVDLPPHLRSIGDYAFSGCQSILEIAVPDTVVNLGQGVFRNCASLLELHLPAGLTRISDFLCMGCRSLVMVNIPDPVAEIGDYAFSQCRALSSIHLPQTVTVIGSFAFSNDRQLEQVTIPAGVTTLGDGAFSDCHRLKSIVIPAQIEEIRAYSFSRCFDLREVGIEAGIRRIGDQAFFGCESLTRMELPDTVESIGVQAFSYCDRLESIRLPERLAVLSTGVLSNCASLKEITIPAAVNQIAPDALHNLKGLARIVVDPDNPAFSSLDGVLYDRTGTVLIHYPATLPGPHFVIPAGVTTVRRHAFHLAENLQRVTIPESVDRIETEGFYLCDQLEYAHFLGNAPDLEPLAFRDCHDSFMIYCLDGRTGFESPGYPVQVLHTGGLSVTFVDWDGTILLSALVTYGQDAIPPVNPVREGYRFTGWDRSSTAVTERLTIHAVYEPMEPPQKSLAGPWVWAGVPFAIGLIGLGLYRVIRKSHRGVIS